jgi:RNA polymerase primary sigma factor
VEDIHRSALARIPRYVGRTAVLAIRPGRSFVTEARHSGADVRTLTDALLARAAGSGGQLRSAEVARAVEDAEVTPSQAKKLLRSLAEAGVTVVVDDSANSRRRVAAARSATPASKATTAKATRKPADPEPVKAEPVVKVVKAEPAAPAAPAVAAVGNKKTVEPVTPITRKAAEAGAKRTAPKQAPSPEDAAPAAKPAKVAAKAG